MGKGQRLSTVRIILYRCFWLTVVECWKRENYLQALWPMEKGQRSVQWELSCNATFDLLMYPWKWVKGQFTENYIVSLFLVDCCWMLKRGIPLAGLVTHGKGSKVSAVRIIMYSCFCVRKCFGAETLKSCSGKVCQLTANMTEQTRLDKC